MRYFVKFSDEQIPVDVTIRPGRGYVVAVDGCPVDVDVKDVNGALSVKIGDRMIDLAIEGEPPHLGLIASGHRFYADVESERYRAGAAVGGRQGGSEKLIAAPMPGRVVSLSVEQDQTVEQGTTVVIIEAMKMENELKASADGVVKRVFVKAGDSVEAGAPLVEFS